APRRLDPIQLDSALSSGVVVDTRSVSQFTAGHIPGTLSIPLNGSFPTWAGWLLPYDRDIFLIIEAARAGAAETAARDLAMIGLDRVAGVFGEDAMAAWTSAGHDLEMVAETNAKETAELLEKGQVAVIDVRA